MATLVPVPPPRMPNAADVDVTNPEEMRDFLLRLTSSVQRHLAARPANSTAIEGRLFKAPDGKVYTLSVNSAGAVAVTPFGSAQTKPVPP